MKQLSELHFPDNCRYSVDHIWVRHEGENVKIGVSDYAQDQLGEVVYVELPETGSSFTKGDSCGVLESIKSVSDILIPVSGSIAGVNTELENSPGLVNDKPYDDGWIIEVTPHSTDEIEGLMSAEEYLNMLRGKELK